MASTPGKEGKQSRKPSAAAPSESAPRRRRWRGKWLLLSLLAGAALFAGGPLLISRTPLKHWLLRMAAPVNGSLDCGSLSLGWFTAPAVSDLELRDDAGEVVARVASVQLDKSLFALVCDHDQLGTIRVERPELHLVLRDDGSNLEDTLAPLLSGSSSGRPPIAARLEVVDGHATIDDRPSKRQYEINDMKSTLDFNGAAAAPLNMVASAQLVSGRETAALDVALVADNPTAAGSTASAEGASDTASPLSSGRVTCKIDGLPLDIVEPLLRRRLAGAQLAGRLSVQLDGSWGGGAEHDQISVSGQLDASNVQFAAAALAGDRIELARIEVPCRITGNRQLVRIEKLAVDCDLGQLSIDGSVRLSDLTATDVAAALAHEPCHASGQLNLVRLAAMLPQTLRLRHGTEITAGQLTLDVASQQRQDAMAWSGHLTSGDLAATANGRTLTWQQPLVIDFSAHKGAAGPVVDKLECSASFLSIEAAGTLDELTAKAQFDLRKLGEELAHFIDFNGVELGGNGQAELVWKRTADGHVGAQLDATARELVITGVGRRPWREASVEVKGDLSGQMTGTTLVRVDTTQLDVTATQERLQVRLAEPVDNPLSVGWPLKVDWQGELAAWPPRLAPWVDLTGWEATGQAVLSAVASCSLQEIEIQQARLGLERCHLWGPGLFIDEPRVELSGSGRLRAPRYELNGASLSTGQLVVKVPKATAASKSDGTREISGNFTVHGDLGELARWLHDPRASLTWNVAGQLAAEGEIAAAGGISRITFDGTLDNCEISDARPQIPRRVGVLKLREQPVRVADWREPRVTLAAQAQYDSARDVLEISEAKVAASALSGQLAGKIAHLSTAPDFDLQGSVAGDWEQTAALWQPMVGDGVQIVGRQAWPFRVRGPWTAGATPLVAGMQRMTAEASVGWERANLYGMHMSGGKLDAVLADGLLTLKPVDVELSGGKLTLAPKIRFQPEPAQIELPKGPFLSHVQLTPEVCKQSLKYVAPILAEVTKTEGQFSIDMQGGRLPLANWKAGDVAGKLQIHQVHVEPGPIAQQLVLFARQIEAVLQAQPLNFSREPASVLNMDDQTVDFRLVDGRVYHRGLQFTCGNVTMSTHGSVGLDESLAVMAEISLKSGLLSNNPRLAGLKDQPLQIPIAGTLEHPIIDPQIIQQLTGKLIEKTAKGLLLDRAEKGLEKLIPFGR